MICDHQSVCDSGQKKCFTGFDITFQYAIISLFSHLDSSELVYLSIGLGDRVQLGHQVLIITVGK